MSGSSTSRTGRRDVPPPSIGGLAAAERVVGRHLSPTPVLPMERLGSGIALKLETFQPTGAFKIRGALVAVARARELTGGPGRLIAASAGNHALAMVVAGGMLDVPVTVVVPRSASTAKLDGLARLGADLRQVGNGYEEAEQAALAMAAAGEGRFVSPYNDPAVIAGAATVAGELRAQVTDLGAVVVPVGGGGLLAGTALALAGTGVRVIGVVAERSPAMLAAHEAGQVVPVTVGPTLADGLAGNLEAGSVTVPLTRQHGLSLLAVGEDEIADAMCFLATEVGLVAEGSGAVGVAAARSGALPEGNGTTVLVITGRNVAPSVFRRVLGTEPGGGRGERR